MCSGLWFRNGLDYSPTVPGSDAQGKVTAERDRPLHFMGVEGTAQWSRMILRLRVLQLIPPYVRSEPSLPDSREGFVARSDLKRNTPPRRISDLLGVERRHAVSWIHQLLWTRFFLSTSICMLTSSSPLSQPLKYLSIFCSGFGSKQANKPRRTGEDNLGFFKLSGWAQDEAAMVWKFPSLSKPRGCNPHLGW